MFKFKFKIFLIAVPFLLVPFANAQEILNLPGAVDVEQNVLTEEELSKLIEQADNDERKTLDAEDIEVGVVTMLNAFLTYQRDVAKVELELSDIEVDRLLERLEEARDVHRQMNTVSKTSMCNGWNTSSLEGRNRSVEAIRNYYIASENAKIEVGDAYQSAIADFQNILGQSGFIKIQEYINTKRSNFASNGQLLTLTDMMSRSQNNDEYLKGLCGGVK